MEREREPGIVRRIVDRRKLAAEFGLLAAAGLFMGALGPFGTDALSLALVYPYWIAAIVGGGAIGIALDALFGRRVPTAWARVLVVAIAMTPFVTAYVLGLNHVLLGSPVHAPAVLPLTWQVFVISLPVMAVRMLAWRSPEAIVETRIVVEPPLPDADAAFRKRLSARRRQSRLLAVEAHDHYLRVHTDDGPELVTLRFADALEELARVHGFRTHRSWWIAADAIERVTWRRGTGEAELVGALVAPISRTYAPALKAAGWF